MKKTPSVSGLMSVLLCSVLPVLTFAAPPMYVFNSDGGAAAIAHTEGKVTRQVVCHELDELEGTAVTDFFWCPIVGGNVFIYPTHVGERMGDNIRDWEKIHPYYRGQGRAMTDNLRQLIEAGEDPIEILSVRAQELGIRFWLTCRMNEIHEDDDRFMVLRSLFKEEHPELLHGKNFHPEAVYAPLKGWSYAWDYSHEAVRAHFLKLFTEWLQYDIDGIELDFVRSPCLFPPGKEQTGTPLLTDFITKLREAVNATAKRRQHQVRLAVRVPPSFELCRAAGIDIKTWIGRNLVDVVTPMDRGYLDPEPNLPEFVMMEKPPGVAILGGIEPMVRNYNQESRQLFAAATSFLYHGADGIYLFNYDCHRLKAKPWKFKGILQPYTPEEITFLKHALDPQVLRNHDKQYFVSHCTYHRLAEDGGTRPLICRLPVGDSKSFAMTIGDDLQQAAIEKRIRSSRLVIMLKDCQPKSVEVNLQVNGQIQSPDHYQFESREPDSTVITLNDPPMHRGTNTVTIGLKSGSRPGGLIRSIDLNIDYWSPADRRANEDPKVSNLRPVMGRQQLFAYIPTCLEIYIKEPRQVAQPSDWPVNMLRFQFPESVNAFAIDGRHLWEHSFETSQHAWRVVDKAEEKTMGGNQKNRVMKCEDTIAGAATIRQTVTWSDEQIDFQLNIKNLSGQHLSALQTSMCMQRTAAPDYIDHNNSCTFLVSDQGFLPSQELAFHPETLNFYGRVGHRLELVDPNLVRHLEEEALFVVSSDKRYVLCYAWRGANGIFMNRAGRVRCLHSDFRFVDVAPQQDIEAQGILFVQPGTLDQAHQRFLAWKRSTNAQG